jgi:uncharacterized protein YggE
MTLLPPSLRAGGFFQPQMGANLPPTGRWQMKMLGAVLTVAALALAAPVAMAQTAAERFRQISVGGEAEVKVTPDRATLVLGMVSESRELPKAQAENAQKIGQAIAMLEKMGIEKRHIQTDFLRIEPRFEKTYGIGPAAYIVRRDIVVTLTDLKKLEPVIAEAVKLGINTAGQFTLETSDLRKHRDAARLLAAQAAREKATLLAQALGATVGPVQTIDETNVPTPMSARSLAPQNVSVEAGGGPPVFSAGEISVRAAVMVTFALQ